MLQRFTGNFLAGIFALLPLIITVAVIAFVANYLNSWLGPSSPIGEFIQRFGGSLWVVYYISSFVMVVMIIWVVGYFTKLFIGQKIGFWFEWTMLKIPFINKVYKSVGQVVDLFKKKDEDTVAALSNVVLVRIANTRILGMLASSDVVVINDVPHYLVYFPSTPIPTTGFNYFIPCEDVDDVDVSVEEMTRVIVSLGSLGPGIMNSKQPLMLTREEAKKRLELEESQG